MHARTPVQAYSEYKVTRQFLRNFSGDQVRFLARGFTVAGDRGGQQSSGHRYPYGPVAIVAPFNFPLEIPVLQLMGALYMGNKVVIKSAEKTAMVIEQWFAPMFFCYMSCHMHTCVHDVCDRILFVL